MYPHFNLNGAYVLVFQIREACQDMVLSEEQLKEIMDKLLRNINEGLSKDGHESSAVKCFITYVQDLPSGKGNVSRLLLRRRIWPPPLPSSAQPDLQYRACYKGV